MLFAYLPPCGLEVFIELVALTSICFLFPGEPPVCAVPVVTENPLPKDALSSTGKP